VSHAGRLERRGGRDRARQGVTYHRLRSSMLVKRSRRRGWPDFGYVLIVTRRLRRLREEGITSSSRRAASILGARAEGLLRTAELRLQPIVLDEQLARSAAGAPQLADSLRERLFLAMPTLAMVDEDLQNLPPSRRNGVILAADAILAHEFNLLGSGPTKLGREIDWHADFTAGRRWPIRHFRLLELYYGDGSDVLFPWVLSWGQHLPLLAAAHRITGRQEFLREIEHQLLSWIPQNRPEMGVNWASPMMVAIRAANWIAALALVAEAAEHEPWFGTALASLWAHGAYLERYMDTEVRNNHYVASLVGLLAVAAVFREHPTGAGWHRAAARRLVEEMRVQVNDDGSSCEGSIAYHRLVCELFLLGGDLVRGASEPALPPWYVARTRKMLKFVADYTRADGSAPQLGDSGNWRCLPLLDYGCKASRYSHLHLLAQGRQWHDPTFGIATYRSGGYCIARTRSAHLIIRCGYARDPGHVHSDQGAFELTVADRAIVVDPGTYVYQSRDPVTRESFRSRAVHSTLVLDDLVDDLGDAPGVPSPKLLAWHGDAFGAYFEAQFFSFLRLPVPATHTRSLDFNPFGRGVTIVDVVDSRACHAAAWTFPIPAASIAPAGSGVVMATFEGLQLRLTTDRGDFTIDEGWYSPDYGVRHQIPYVRLRHPTQPGRDVTSFTFEFRKIR
jgi:Heparinase II/III-like protein/Heparinase II/III N-terminus